MLKRQETSSVDHRARHIANAKEWKARLDRLDLSVASHEHAQALRDIIACECRMANVTEASL